MVEFEERSSGRGVMMLMIMHDTGKVERRWGFYVQKLGVLTAGSDRIGGRLGCPDV